jgi:hypothetical protein
MECVKWISSGKYFTRHGQWSWSSLFIMVSPYYVETERAKNP